MIKILKEKVSNIEETKLISKKIFQILKTFKNFTVFFDGDLGAGKTFMIRELLRKFEIKDDVTSPTFITFNEYCSEKSNLKFVHFDFYRLENPKDFFTKGLADIAFEEDSFKFVEWREKISQEAQKTFSGTKFLVTISRTKTKEERLIEFEKIEKMLSKLSEIS